MQKKSKLKSELIIYFKTRLQFIAIGVLIVVFLICLAFFNCKITHKDTTNEDVEHMGFFDEETTLINNSNTDKFETDGEGFVVEDKIDDTDKYTVKETESKESEAKKAPEKLTPEQKKIIKDPATNKGEWLPAVYD